MFASLSARERERWKERMGPRGSRMLAFGWEGVMFQIIALPASFISLIFVSEYLNLTFSVIVYLRLCSLGCPPSSLVLQWRFQLSGLSCLLLSLFLAAFRGLT